MEELEGDVCYMLECASLTFGVRLDPRAPNSCGQIKATNSLMPEISNMRRVCEEYKELMIFATHICETGSSSSRPIRIASRLLLQEPPKLWP